jgi:hypothetical protein
LWSCCRSIGCSLNQGYSTRIDTVLGSIYFPNKIPFVFYLPPQKNYPNEEKFLAKYYFWCRYYGNCTVIF